MSISMQKIAAHLTQRITLEEAVETADGGGGSTESWQPYATVWAKAEPLRGREDYVDMRLAAERSYRFTIRYLGGVEPGMRVTMDSRVFNIRAVINQEEADVILELLCEEGVAV